MLPDQEGDVLELDAGAVGRWSYVCSKKYRVWIWVVLCRRTHQVVVWMWGDRNAHICQMLWEKVPDSYKGAFCYSILLEAYQKILHLLTHPT